MKFVEDINIDWDDINNRLKEEHDKRIADLKKTNSETKIIEATIYDIIVEGMKGNDSAHRYLHFLNQVFNDLSQIINGEERKIIKKNIVDFLTQMDKNYLNYVGEIAALHSLLNKKIYTLEGVEEKLSNGCSIDFKLRKTEDKSLVLVEIDNIHPKSDKIENDAEKIKTFFNGRYNQKLKEKNKGLEEKKDFAVVHVIWSGKDDLKIYSDYFKNNKNQTDNINEPLAYLSLSDYTGYFENRFGRLSNLFNSN
jgi:hypothetical protein